MAIGAAFIGVVVGASYLWLANAPLASGATLRCDQIDALRCRQSAVTAVDWFDRVRSQFRTGEVIVSAEVWADDPTQTICHGQCAPGELAQVRRLDVVKVTYLSGGRDWLELVWCANGRHTTYGSPFPFLEQPGGSC